MEAFVTQRWPAAPPVLPQLLGARSPFQACPRRPGRGGWGAGLASGGAQFTCPVSGFVDPLILQPCFSLLHTCLSALAPVHQVQVPVRRLPPLCRFFLPGEGKGQDNASGPLVQRPALAAGPTMAQHLSSCSLPGFSSCSAVLAGICWPEKAPVGHRTLPYAVFRLQMHAPHLFRAENNNSADVWAGVSRPAWKRPCTARRICLKLWVLFLRLLLHGAISAVTVSQQGCSGARRHPRRGAPGAGIVRAVLLLSVLTQNLC